MKRKGVLVLGAVLAGAAAYAVPTVWGRPWSPNTFYMRVLVEGVWQSPELCTTLHLLDWRKGNLDDLSPASLARGKEFTARALATLHGYDRASMTPEEQTSYDVMDFFLRESEGQDSGAGAGPAGGSGPYSIDQLGGLHVAFPDFMIHHHDVNSASDAEHYLERLAKVGAQFDQVIESARADADHGVIPPRFILAEVERDARAFAATPSGENALVTSFATKLAGVKGLSESERAGFVARATKAIDDTVKPAYGRYVDYVVALEGRATDDAGLWHTTGGEARYARFLRSGTASTMSADEVHALGVSEVARLEDEMRKTLAKLGLPTDSPEAEVRRLHGDARFQMSPAPEARQAILDRYRSILDDMAANIGKVSTLPIPVKLDVKPVPAFKEATAPGAYYEPPPMDDSSLGTFFVNLAVPQFTFDMRTLAYHEGIPGHHFQVNVARHIHSLPLFRQLIPFNSYDEGWALWAEQVAADLGFEDDPYDRLGFLSAQLFRAARLVVDTGIHAKRWTRAEALAYFDAHTTEGDKGAEIEIDRYVVWPGQACGYMVGKKTIEGLAEKAKARLGPKFDLRKFNDVVLGSGALPLPVLTAVVDRWLDAQGPA